MLENSTPVARQSEVKIYHELCPALGGASRSQHWVKPLASGWSHWLLVAAAVADTAVVVSSATTGKQEDQDDNPQAGIVPAAISKHFVTPPILSSLYPMRNRLFGSGATEKFSCKRKVGMVE